MKWREGCDGSHGIACSPCMRSARDAPDAAADLASALGVADARIVAPVRDAVGRRVAQAHAMKRIGAPVLVRRRSAAAAGRGEAGAVISGAALAAALMLSA